MQEYEDVKAALVQDSMVKACASVFPTDVWVVDTDGHARGTKSCRFVLALHPADGRWAVLAWANVSGSSIPTLIIAGWVESIQQLDSRSISVTLEDGTIVRSKPQNGCACGTRLRNWAAWGDSVRLVAVPKPELPLPVSA